MRTGMVLVVLVWLAGLAWAEEKPEAMQTWRYTLGSRITVDESIWRQADPAEALKRHFASVGVPFPEGSSLEVDAAGRTLTVRNTVGSLRHLFEVLGLLHEERCQVRMHLEVLAIDPALAKAWGLDGGPATKPDEVPVKGRLFPVLDEAAGASLLTALRKRDDVMVVAATDVTTISGVTGVVDNTVEMQFPETIEGELGESEEMGLIFRVTPTVAADGVTVDLELEPVWRVLAGWIKHPHPDVKMMLPVIVTVSWETRIMVLDGQTFLAPGRVVRVPPGTEKTEEFVYRDKVLLMMLTTRLSRGAVQCEVIEKQ